MKFVKVSTILLLVAALVVLSGCSSSKSAKETMLDAMANNQDAKSMTYTGKMTLNELSLPQKEVVDGKMPAVAPLILSMLKGAVINFHGKVQKSPARAELVMDMTLGSGDVKLNVSLPMIITADKVWIKVPQIPGYPMLDALSGKFVEIDAKKLAQEQGVGDLTASQNIGQDLLKALLGSLDEKTFFSEPKGADMNGLPEGQEADKFVRFAVDESNKDTALTAVMEKAAPQIIDILLSNESYMKALQLKKEQLEAAKKELSGGNTGKAKDAVDTFKKSVKIGQLEVTGGIKDDYLTYEGLNVELESTDAAAGGLKLDMHYEMSISDINKDVKFEYELPKDAIPVEQLQGMLGLPSGS
ncbi:hypothetical protein [Paenibacillus sp. OV219]|uniref:hypothetical protein n=1 Tax=Paenibacillus sp. OV219 TaxID=1884377 RepID=UPI0008B7376B|nr:hypothetical protein [Paenibacillus sp. OV219]SEO79310.1 hypothetical protein SAMN05518847_11111 [Paenibacillus sp. OV219]